MTKKLIILTVLTALSSVIYSAALWRTPDTNAVEAYAPLKIVVRCTDSMTYLISLNGLESATIVRPTKNQDDSSSLEPSLNEILHVLHLSPLIDLKTKNKIETAYKMAKNPQLIKEEYIKRLALITQHHDTDFPIWPSKCKIGDRQKKAQELYDLYYSSERREKLIEQRFLTLITINRIHEQKMSATLKEVRTGAAISG